MKTLGAFIDDFTFPGGYIRTEALLSGAGFAMLARPAAVSGAKPTALEVTRPNKEKPLPLGAATHIEEERTA